MVGQVTDSFGKGPEVMDEAGSGSCVEGAAKF